MKKGEAFFRKNAVWIGLAFFFLLFLQIYSRALSDRSDGLYATHTNIWSDWSLHVAMANLFAFQPVSEWFLHHPVWSGGGFTYPFLTNLIPGMLMRAGVGLVPAMNFTALLFSYIFLWGAFRLGERLTKSARTSLVSITIFIFSSGVRGLPFWGEEILKLFRGEWTLSGFLNLPQDPSRIEGASWLAGNVLEATIFPQRAMLLGMTLAVWALVLVYRGKDCGKEGAATSRARGVWNRSWVVSGLLVGLLPVAHMHTLIALVFILPFLFFSEIRERRFGFVVNYLPGVVLTGILYFAFVHGKIENPSFMIFEPFWTQDSLVSWVSLWLAIWGVFLPLAFFAEGARLRALGWKRAFESEMFAFSFGFFLLFFVSNMILFQPTRWDNSKLFFWCYFGLSFTVASLLEVFRESSRKWSRVFSRVCFFLLICTGVIEVIRIVHYAPETYRMTERSLMELGEKIRSEVHPREVFLTAPIHNHFVSLWGTQPIFMGYPAWTMNYGFPWSEREALLKEMLSGKMDPARFESEAKTHQIRYVVIGADERRYLPELDEGYFSSRYKEAFQGSDVRIYDLKQRKND